MIFMYTLHYHWNSKVQLTLLKLYYKSIYSLQIQCRSFEMYNIHVRSLHKDIRSFPAHTKKKCQYEIYTVMNLRCCALNLRWSSDSNFVKNINVYMTLTGVWRKTIKVKSVSFYMFMKSIRSNLWFFAYYRNSPTKS